MSTEDPVARARAATEFFAPRVPGQLGCVFDHSSPDIVVFVAVGKLDRQGATVHFEGSVGNKYDLVSRGFCRVPRRELDPVRSTEWQPVPTGTSERRLRPGEIVPVDIAIYPSSTFFAAGETLELIVAADEIIHSPPYMKNASCNRGRHVLHLGGEYDSYLLVPAIPGAEE